jgi:hypothetical protein
MQQDEGEDAGEIAGKGKGATTTTMDNQEEWTL